MKTQTLGVIVVALVLTVAWIMYEERRGTETPPPVGCTMDARICPDGSAVGRVGPHCEFAPCPDITNTTPQPEPPAVSEPPMTGGSAPFEDDILPPPEYEQPWSGEVACTMDAKMCSDGSYVGRVAPYCNFAPCPGEENIRVTSPQTGATITSPITVKGTARGNWFFEASFPISIVNWDGLIIGEGIATAQGDWMTTDFVPFTAKISYTIDSQTPYNHGAIILKKDNPSGLPENDASIEIPVTFGELPESENLILSQ